MSLFTKSNNKGSSRTQIAIKGAEDGILILPNGEYRAILELSSINLDLKSEKEQDAILETYQRFLNSLACPIQILVQIREMDMDKYLSSYEARLEHEEEEVYKQQILGYTAFVKKLIKTNKILSRRFYIVVPYKETKKSSIELVREQLNLHIEIIESGLAKIGIHSRQLDTIEVLNLFYTYYNPEFAKTQPLRAQTIQTLAEQLV
jgi:hypothetical protein